MSDDGLKAALTEAARNHIEVEEAVFLVGALWPLVSAELARQRQQGREDAAQDVERAWFEEPWERGPINYHAQLARGTTELQQIRARLSVPVSEGVRAVYRNLDGPTHEEQP